ncbi:MAG: succinyl-diaminopimelate desuccinylase [Verrucomicrobiae bacterium]|nr:succinyl-diaminopimelate desuccinylase [Pedosphaera sp.]MBL6845228.1 succinyl-diaminopimelate desuccinylase [Verrucomicrobiae bacterium]HCP37173.1 succinyl-diaminopimelate desuccinylase [Verrucomicrobiales bacterium]HCZ05255.1 succinyl-diaminopimelate desuccinylase [Verrucomicrobiales bacterium]|tara:strand:- start:5211 stop:6374 length:1164 start_codon:yes stop_codon:yes gene_type:complete
MSSENNDPSKHPATLLAKDLIRCASIAPNDAGAQLLLRKRLETKGFDVTAVDVDGVLNTWACYGTEGPLMVFAVHADVVPSGDANDWTSPPFEPEIREGKLFGRGAADMKGPLSAAVIAVEQFLIKQKKAMPLRIGFIIAGDEEPVNNHGTQDVLDYLKKEDVTIDYCMVTEPTSLSTFGDIIKVGRRGSINGFLTLLGKQGHSAYPELAMNPVHQSFKALQSLTERVWDQGDEHFPAAGFQITNVAAGTGAANVIPGKFNVQFNLRHGPGLSLEMVDASIRQTLDGAGLRYELKCVSDAKPFKTKQGILTQICREVVSEFSSQEPHLSTGGGTSDARFIAPHSRELVEFGLVGDTSHHVDEHIIIYDLVRLVRVYEKILDQLIDLA